MDGSSKVDIKSLISGWEAKTQGDQKPVQRREASATGAMNRPVSINWKNTATIKASEVKRMTLPPTKGEVTVQKPPQKSLEVQAKEIKLSAGEKAPPALEAKSDAISVESRAVSESEVELPPHPDDPLPKPPLEASARKTVQLQKLKEMGSIQDIKAFAGITETKKTDSASLLQQQIAAKMEAQEAWGKLDPAVQSYIPKLGIIDSSFVATPPREEEDPTPEKMRENFANTLPMLSSGEQKSAAEGLALAAKMASSKEQQLATLGFLSKCASAADFELAGTDTPKPNPFAEALGKLKNDPKISSEGKQLINEFVSRTPHQPQEAASIFSEKGISAQELGVKVKKANKKEYQKLVNDFASSLTNAHLQRFASVKKTGDFFPYGEKGKPQGLLGNATDLDSEGLGNYVKESILTGKNRKEAQRMANFYGDVVVALNHQKCGAREGANLCDQLHITSALVGGPVGTLNLTDKIPVQQKTVLDGVLEKMQAKKKGEVFQEMNQTAVVPQYGLLGSTIINGGEVSTLEGRIDAFNTAVGYFSMIQQNAKASGTIPPPTLQMKSAHLDENALYKEAKRIKGR